MQSNAQNEDSLKKNLKPAVSVAVLFDFFLLNVAV